MRRHRVWLVLACAAALWCAVPLLVSATAQAGALTVAGTWRTAIEVPGTGALNEGGVASVGSLSCTSAGNCLAGGNYYTDSSGDTRPFVASERNGAWRTAIEVPGVGALSKVEQTAQVNSVSCASVGNCLVGGNYTDRYRHSQAFVASERDGTWRRAIEVPGTGALNKGRVAVVISVSCGSAGSCAAGGYYEDRAGGLQAFVASERNGTWRTAIEVPGTGALNTGGDAVVNSVSCASAGNCLAGGSYTGRAGHRQAFVASERDGTWRRAIEVPGTGALNKSGDATVTSVSCGSTGNCAAGGDYRDRSGEQVFVASEREGSWRTAIEVPGTHALNKGGFAGVTSVSCGSAGNCAAGGFYEGGAGPRGRAAQAFVASERNGTWHIATAVPGTRALNKGGNGGVTSVSCASAGNCLAGGYYTDSSRHSQAFVASERNDIWHTAIEVPGTRALNNGGNAYVNSVSCAPAGHCAVGGPYEDGSGNTQAFVANRT